MSPLRLLTSVVGVVAILACVEMAQSQTARSGGGGGAAAQLLQQMQQLASERTSLQAENASMKKELDQLRKERDGLKKGQQAVEGRVKAEETALARGAAQHDAIEQELKQTKDRMQELIAKFRETIQTLREVETERATLKQTLDTEDRNLKVCLDHNAALYKLDGEVLDRLEHQSAWTRMATIEPFTKIKRVQLENLVDDFKARAADQVLKAPPAGTSLSSPAVPASPAAASASPPAAPATGAVAPASGADAPATGAAAPVPPAAAPPGKALPN